MLTTTPVLSNAIKKRFVKDMMLPIQVIQEPYFSIAIAALDPHFGSIQKLKLLTDMLAHLGENAENKMFALSKSITEGIIEAIKETPAYKEWSNSDTKSTYEYQNKGISKSSVYTPINVDQPLISIDLVSANFTSLRNISKDMVLGCDTYSDLIGLFTEYDYFKQSKQFRQIIFGSLCPKKQQTLWKITMDKIVTVLREQVGVEKEEIITLSTDEVIIMPAPKFGKLIGNIELMVQVIQGCLRENELTRYIGNDVRVDAFNLRLIEGSEKKYYVKEHLYPRKGKVEFKCVPNYFFMQVYKQYLGQPILKEDLVFYHDGLLATFKTSLYDNNKEEYDNQ